MALAQKGLPDSLAGVPRQVEEVIRAGLEPDPLRRPGLAAFQALLHRTYVRELAEELRRLARRSACPTRLEVTLAAAREADKRFQTTLSCNNEDASPATQVRTGDLLRIEARADREGYLTILNFSSTGELEVLLPNPVNTNHKLKMGQPHKLTVKLTPPAGADRTAVIWTRTPSPLRAEEWRDRIVGGRVTEPDRGMAFVDHQASDQPADDWTAVVVTIVHQD
jgi:hypothetical protein